MPALPVLVFLIFLVMKLAEIGSVADWSWWWVTSPLWIAAAVYVVIILPLQLLFLKAAKKSVRSIHRGFRDF